VIFILGGQLLSSGGVFLGEETNNVVEYSAVIEILRDSLSQGISCFRVYLDAQLVVSKLNSVYHIYDPTLHQRFLRVRLLEIYFDFITYIHVPRIFNHLIDSLAHQVLYWHVYHI
jgi:ribonuclease HI